MKPPAAMTATLALALAGCGSGTHTPPPHKTPTDTGMALTSPAFHDAMPLPARFTCEGPDFSPPLGIAGVPAGTQELAIVLFDRNAHNFLHWVVFAIPPDVLLIREGEIPPNALQATTSFGSARYGGPCPPRGQLHVYDFALFAEPTRLELAPGSNGRAAFRTIKAGASARTDLHATYTRRG
jgi:Raf kinase inhibitor-like YbhB/YbcL family protein